MKIGIFSLKNNRQRENNYAVKYSRDYSAERDFFFSCIIPEDLTRISGGKSRREI